MRRIYLMILVLAVGSLFIGCKDVAQVEELNKLKTENTELQEKLVEAEKTIVDLTTKLEALAPVEEVVEGEEVKEVKEVKKEEKKEVKKEAPAKTNKKKKVKK